MLKLGMGGAEGCGLYELREEGFGRLDYGVREAYKFVEFGECGRKMLKNFIG